LNGTHQLLAYAYDVNLLGDNKDTINKNTRTLIDASKEVGLEVNVEKTEYMLVSRDQNAGQNRDIANQNFIHEEIKRGTELRECCVRFEIFTVMTMKKEVFLGFYAVCLVSPIRIL
jgi:hypothetical protein